MKVVHMFGHAPMFEMEFDERAIFISALHTFTASFPQDETAKLMLKTAKGIDEAMRAMRQIANQEKTK